MIEDNTKFYIVSTPIGNLEDISYRAIRILKEVDIILCEDTRHSIKLLNHYEIKNKLLSYHKFNEEEMKEKIISFLLEGKKIALISDAGTPLISDPGSVIVNELIKNDISFTTIPGANALLPGLILSGFESTSFTFMGFLPKKKSRRKEVFEKIKTQENTLIFYSSPYELADFLTLANEALGDRDVCICKEITKIHENANRTNLSKASLEYQGLESIKGEFVIIIKGYTPIKESLPLEEIQEIFKKRTKGGENPKEVIKILAKENHINKRMLYEYLMKK